ncbi:MAG TPA: SdrD B-like domain-containing protein [Solirubrobacteraceae bacterium]|nr:SdrD B-like domain-containing protein [Solirubrobacteraceae bacterium]
MPIKRTSTLLALAATAAAAGAIAFAPGAEAGRAAPRATAHSSQATPAVSGTVFGDVNSNGVRDPGEVGLAGWTVYVDLHSNGVVSADDPQAVTGADGTFAITAVPSGTYLVEIVQQPGYSCTLLGGCLVQQTFPAAGTVVATFGEHQATSTPPPVPPPALGKTFSAGVVSGTVLIQLPPGAHASAAATTPVKGTGFVPLTEARSLPVGTIVDSTRGQIGITSAVNTAGLTQSGVFGGSIFKVLQDRRQKGLTQMNVVIGRSASACPAIGKAARTAAKRLLPSSVLAILHANAKGRFRTRGRFSSATVRGTTWDTIERCDGTLTAVKRGSVVVLDTRHRRSVIVAAGRSYLARR